MEFSEGNSHFDLNLFLSFRLTFPEQDKSGVRGGSYQQLTAAVLPPNQKPGGREEPERKKAGRKYCPGHFRGCLPHTEIKGLGVGGGDDLLQSKFSASWACILEIFSHPCKSTDRKPAMGIRNASTLKVSCKLTTNSDRNVKCKSHPAGILSFPAIHPHNHPPNQKATAIFALQLAKEANTAAPGAGWGGGGTATSTHRSYLSVRGKFLLR